MSYEFAMAFAHVVDEKAALCFGAFLCGQVHGKGECRKIYRTE